MERMKYPRVTTIISETEPPEKKQALIRWQKKMQQLHGVDGAEKEKQSILDNGTSVHLSIEKFLLDEPLPSGLHPQARSVFGLLNQLKYNSGRLIIERRLFCDRYCYQGKPDLICEYQGIPTIIDWTTSAQPKKEQHLEHKFIQAGAYAIAAEHELKICIRRLMVVVCVENPRTFQIFTDSPSKWRIAFLRRLGKYNKMYGVKRK